MTESINSLLGRDAVEYDFDLPSCMYALKYDELTELERLNLIDLVNLQLAYDHGWRIVPFMTSFEVFNPYGHRVWNNDSTRLNRKLHFTEGVFKVIPDYWNDVRQALLLFAHQRDIRLHIDPMGFDLQWKVGYECVGNRYIPGSGSYYDLPEAIVRAYVAFKTYEKEVGF